MKSWIIYFRECNIDDMDSFNCNPMQKSIYEAATSPEAIKQLREEVGEVEVVDIFMMRGLD